MSEHTHTLTAEIVTRLAERFPLESIEVKPGAVRQDGAAALALAYADWRVYADRLDAVVGPANWSIQLAPWGPTRVIARLTILGVTKDASGEGDPSDDNCGTIAEAQAKKRACAEFGLGRYLYNLPQLWAEGQGDRRNFRFNDPRRVAWKVYAQAGFIRQEQPQRQEQPHQEPRREAPRQEQPQRQPAPQSAPARANGHANGHANGRSDGFPAPDPERLGRARAALGQAEQRTAVADAPQPTGKPASDRQRGAIIALIARCAELDVSPSRVNAIGQQAGITNLSGFRKPEQLPGTLTSPQASAIIDGLKGYTGSYGGGGR
ncbi:MAG: hypothetical protein RLZZ387_256 [Chloroflexota bacterium]|jgi:hypothetical protein